MLTEPLVVLRVSPAIEMGVAAVADAANETDSATETSAEVVPKTRPRIGNWHRSERVKTFRRVLNKLSTENLQAVKRGHRRDSRQTNIRLLPRRL
jgi:hypothetical protein